MIKNPVVLPPNRQWTQANTGNLFGSLYSTRNVTLSVPGVASLSPRMRYVGRDATSGSDFGYIAAIPYDGRALTGEAQYYIITNNKVWTLNSDLSGFAVDATASTPSLQLSSDGLIWNDGLYVTTVNNLSKLVGGVWTGSLMSLSGSSPSNIIPHPLCVSTINNFLLVGNGNKLEKRTTAGVNSTALTLPDNYRIQWVRSDNARVLIGTRNLNGGNAAVFDWDETAAAATNKYDVDANWVYAGEFRNTDFFIVTNDGRLQKFNGGGFSTVAQWPIYKTLQGNWVSGFSFGTVFQRGLNIIEGKVTIMLNGEIENGYESSPFYENFSSGIWEFDEATGLSHKYGLSISQSGQDFTQIELGGGSGAVAPIYVDPITGAPNPTTAGQVLLTGARLSDGTATEYYALCSVNYGVNRGEIESTRIETIDIADQSSKIYCKFRGVWTADDTIIFKYKDYTDNHLPFTTANDITWTSTTTFTSTSTSWQYAAVGDEVTVVRGKGAGAAAHISTISLNAGTYTITLDEAIPNVANAETSKAICDNYKKLNVTITSADVLGWKEISIPQTNPATWIQIKAEMRGSQYVTIEELQFISLTHDTPTP